jgi:hypothetical protein
MTSLTTLVERIATGDASKIAILGLGRGAGKTTTLSHLAHRLQERGIGVGIAASGREEDEFELTEAPRQVRISARSGTVVSTTAAAIERATARLETIERTDIQTTQGPLLIARTIEDGEVEPIGPGAAEDLRVVVEAVARHSGGRVLIEGSFDRRGFAAPGVADAIVIAVGAAMAPEIERIVAGTRYYLDLFSLPRASDRVAEMYPVAESEGAAIMLGEGGSAVGGVPWRQHGNAEAFLSHNHPSFARLVVPRSVGDDFVIPLLREKVRFEIVVRDPMRISLSPVYYSAWKKLGGGITVVSPSRVLALSLNPTNPAGPDLDPHEMLAAFREKLPDVPSHDVSQEETPAPVRKRWFGLGDILTPR